MIQLSGVNKFFGTQILFENVSFSINSREKVGLVGRNGSGKSTLLKIIQGEIASDSGQIRVPKGYKIGSLTQHLDFSKPTLIEECSKELKGEERYDFFKVEKILFGLGFSQEDLQKSPNSFSGGYQIRIELTKLLLKRPNLLLLDEPTNYLDIVSLRWLKSFIRDFPGEVVLITHDREFMDGCVNQVLGISQRKIKKIKGTTKAFYERIEQDNRIDEKTKENQLKKKEHLESFVNRFRAKASKAKQAQSKMKQLDKLDIRDDYVSEEYLGFRFPYKDCPSKNFLKVEDFHFSYKEGIEIIKGFNLMVRKGDRIAIIGKNGKGKSTLLNLLAEELKPSRGQLSPHPALERGHFGQTNIKRLTETNTIVDEIYASNTDLSQSSVRGICGTMMFSDDLANKKIAVLSGGEKSRVLLGKILATPTNLLLLDEPTNHLDMESVDVLIDQINDFKGASIIVTHNEQLLRKFAKKLIVFHQEKVEVFEGDYDEFLEKIGWEDENNFGAVSENNRKSSWKNNKKLRAEIIKERSKVLGPLKKESEKVEEDICAFEALLSKKNEEIISLSSGGEGQKISLLSKEVKMLENKVDNLFLRLEELTELIENRQKDFEAQLKEIGP